MPLSNFKNVNECVKISQASLKHRAKFISCGQNITELVTSRGAISITLTLPATCDRFCWLLHSGRSLGTRHADGLQLPGSQSPAHGRNARRVTRLFRCDGAKLKFWELDSNRSERQSTTQESQLFVSNFERVSSGGTLARSTVSQEYS